MKIIALDVDGVLNSYHCKNTLHGFTFLQEEKLVLLKELVDASGAKLLLSSTWREGWRLRDVGASNERVQEEIRFFEVFEDKLAEYGLRLYDYTPTVYALNRGKEIAAWLETHPEVQVDSMVVLDDMDGRHLRPFSRYLVQTSMVDGLQQRHLDRALRILNTPWVQPPTLFSQEARQWLQEHPGEDAAFRACPVCRLLMHPELPHTCEKGAINDEDTVEQNTL